MKLTLDIETNRKHDTIWCNCAQDVETGAEFTSTNSAHLKGVINGYESFIGHNIIGFDARVLNKVWDVVLPPESLVDTLVMSRLYNPSIDGGHSLDAWGKRFGKHKLDFTDYDGGLTDEMIEYCQRDVELTTHLYKWLTKALKDEGFSDYSVELEHKVALIIQQQVENGFKLDVDKANGLYSSLMCRMKVIEQELQVVFPPIVEQRVSEKTGKQLKEKVTHFNPGSRQQIAERLQSLGAVFSKETEKGSTVINEDTLSDIDLPEARLVVEYLTLQKRTSQIDSWLKEVKEDGRVHGRVRSNGAVTGRMTHSNPNLAQVPAVGKLYGAECRSCWTVDEGCVLVGADASGLELRMLAHYMDDVKYTHELLSGDIHTSNQLAAGLQTRNQAKTFIYAFLYGAGAEKIGSIVGGNAREGTRLTQRFLENTPALAALKKRVQREAAKGTLKGLDGRMLRVRSEHSALNTLLQGAGAIVMKQALVILDDKLKQYKLPAKFVANVHDEWQIECAAWAADAVGKCAVQSIVEAGEFFQMKCPLDGEYKVGNNWAETH
jgi:DNA polymerase-1